MRLLLVAMAFLLSAATGCGMQDFASVGVIRVTTSSGASGKAWLATEEAALVAFGNPMLAAGDRLEVSADPAASLLFVSVRSRDAVRSQETARKIMEAYVALPRTGFEVKLLAYPVLPERKSRRVER